MDATKFKLIYNESRNGCNDFYRHPLMRRFQYSDGVKDLADVGCHWLLDILATECPKPLRASGEVSGIVKVAVGKKGARITRTSADDKPPIWKRRIEWTDMPEGEYLFELVDEGERFALVLLTER